MNPKVPFILLLLLTFHCVSAQQIQKKIDVESKIESVRIYLEGAQVMRNARVDVPAGKTTLIFKGISRYIDKQSIQVSSSAELTLLSVTSQVNVLEQKEKRKEIGEIQDRQWQITKRKEELNSQKAAFDHEYNLLTKNLAVGGANVGLSTEELTKAADFHRQRIREILHNKLNLDRELFQLDSTLTMLNKQLELLNNEKDESSMEILVTVSADKAIKDAPFELTYYTGNARWFVDYDLRVNDVQNPFDLFFKANISQSTGEDWKEVKLTITNSNPSKTADIGILNPWELTFDRPMNNGNNAYGEVIGKGGFDRVEGIVLDQSGEPLIGATVLVPETAIGTVTDIDGTFSLNIPTSAKTLKFSYTGFSDTEVPLNSAYLTVRMEEASELLEIVTVSSVSRGLRIRGLSNLNDKHLYIPFNTVVERPLTIEYEIEAPYTILSDGKTHRIDVVQFEVPAVYSYSSIPKKKEAAFLTAQVPDWQELNLPTGEVNLFFENAYIGKSLLNTEINEDTLEISLGEDKGVFIDRKMIKEFSKKQLIGKNRVVELEFEIFVRNDKRSAIDLTVYDQIPVSFEKSIVVDNVEISDGELDEKTGIITWKVKLNPGESRTFQKKYRVKYPKANGYLKLER